MKKLFTFFIISLIYCPSFTQNVTHIEYFVDTDAGTGNNTVVAIGSPSSDGSFSFNVNLTGVSEGFHKLYIRTKDSDGRWSQTTRRNIQVLSAQTADNIVAAEYFIDTDPGIRNGTPITGIVPGQDISIAFNANTSSLSPGFHKLYIRTKDAQDKWSITARRNIEVLSPESNAVTAAEYFFDTDPGHGNGTPIPISPQGIDITQSFIGSTSSLPPGFHKLYIRTKNDQGKWSITARRNAEVILNDGPLYVSGVEYFFGSDPGIGNATFITFPSPQTDGTFNITIPANQIPTGVDTLYMRVKDSTNKHWSLTALKTKYFITASCPTSIWLGTVSNDWHNPSNWSCNQVPNAATEVVIVSLTPYNCEVLAGNTATCKKITAVAGSAVKVNTGATLNVFAN